MTDTKIEALRAIDKIRAHYGREPICCGGFVEGDPGDGWMQPPDPPSCCQQPDADVAMLLDDIAGALSAVEPERDRLDAECEALRVDAERYRWLRTGDNDEAVMLVYDTKALGRCRAFNPTIDAAFLPRGHRLDAAIDAAMGGKESQGGSASGQPIGVQP